MAKDIIFKFNDDDMADRFLGYMSDGGGEYHFIELAQDLGYFADFDYHSANAKKSQCGPVVIVKTTPKQR